MIKAQFTLISKKSLTPDVYELIYDCPDFLIETVKPGHYVLFQLAPWLSRAYSFSSFRDRTFTLIIKRIPDGRWSPIICDAPIGTVFSWLLPLGHFLLRETMNRKCFIGTGTGFAPLYAGLLGLEKLHNTKNQHAFIFGVRHFEDSFYFDEIQRTLIDFENTLYLQYFSREKPPFTEDIYRSWYVTDWITEENISQFDEFYLCGSPAMVTDARTKLSLLGVSDEQILWEQF
jgi:NAD(P)H-flavin reductase